MCRPCDTKVKLKSLQKQVLQLEQKVLAVRERIIFEANDILIRMKNLMVYNFRESYYQSEEDRQQDDRFRIIEEISKICLINTTHIYVSRIGDNITNIPRPLIVRLREEDDVHTVMRNRHSCISGLRFAYDDIVLQYYMDSQTGDMPYAFEEAEPVVVEEIHQNMAQPLPQLLNYAGVVIQDEQSVVGSNVEHV